MGGRVTTAAAAVTAFALATKTGHEATPATGKPDAVTNSSMLLVAAEHTEKVSTLRMSFHVAGGFGGRGETAGSDSRVLYTGEGTSSVTTVVGDREYTTQDGKTTWKKLSDTARLAPFARSAADVVRAASKDPQVQSIGQEKVRGVKAIHYRVTLPADGDAQSESDLTKLPESELAWFDLDNVEGYSDPVNIDIWVADNLVRRIATTVKDQPESFSEFYDFNTPITITAPEQATPAPKDSAPRVRVHQDSPTSVTAKLG